MHVNNFNNLLKSRFLILISIANRMEHCLTSINILYIFKNINSYISIHNYIVYTIK